MQLTVTGRRLTVSDATRRQIHQKVRRLERLLGDAAISLQCVIARERAGSICELTLHASGDHVMHAEGRHARVETAITTAVAKLDQQAQKLKDRWKTRRRAAKRATVGRRTTTRSVPVVDTDASRPFVPRIIRSRRQAVKPLTIDDAALALDDSPKEFLVFRQADSGAVAILYRRPDGHLGLIEPGS